jgi:hypothetical protein
MNPKLKNLLILGGINFALLFCLGFGNFYRFIEALRTKTAIQYWEGNHSISSYCNFINRPDLAPILMLLIGVGWLYVCWKARGFDVLALFYFTLVSLLISPLSHDYTLVILILPITLLIKWDINGTWLFIISLLYFSMQYSYAQKIILQNNGITLLLLSGITIYLIIQRKYLHLK